LWYSGILALALLACGLILYFGLHDLTIAPVQASLHAFADFESHEWAEAGMPRCGNAGPRRGPAPPRPEPAMPIYLACYGASGTLVSPQSTTIPDEFLSPSLLSGAMTLGAAADIVDVPDVGPVYRLATAVYDRSTGNVLGVVQVGRSIALQVEVLELLRNLLLLIAGLALLASVVIGLVLAERALEPARLAFGRQQAFIADASHQLRTPLTILRADAEVLLRRRDRFDADDAELLDDIVAETEHMDQLATNLLTLARLDAGRQRLELEVIDLSEVAADIARRVASLAREKGLRLEEAFDDHPRLLGDRHAVEQAALILVDNAIKYTPSGGTVLLRTGAEDGKADFIVEDTGVGVPADRIHRLGERFYRMDPARSHKGGAGLGLAIARGIAAAHGGSVEVAPNPGGGTRAVLALKAIVRSEGAPARAPVR
jgi:signal transduction histidine kinase